jgi:hypothetical protein
VEQLSLPYRIGLVALLVVGGLWFAVLRPKGGDTTPASTPAPGVTGLANDVTKAKGAVATSNAAAARSESAANAVGGATSTPAKPAATAAKPATPAPKPVAPKPAKPGLADDAAPGDPSRPLLASIDSGRVAVVLFSDKHGSDDRATARALKAIDRHHGKVVTIDVPIANVGNYEAITRGVQILESPTILVIGAGGKAREITGYTQAGEINQAVSDIGGKGFTAKKAFVLTGFARTADDVCKDLDYALRQATDPPTTTAELSKQLGVAERQQARAIDRMVKSKPLTAGQRELKKAMVASAKKDNGWIADARHKLKAGADPNTVFVHLEALENHSGLSYHAAARKLHVRGCYATG